MIRNRKHKDRNYIWNELYQFGSMTRLVLQRVPNSSSANRSETPSFIERSLESDGT
ncbi:hypothetical protein LEP1GSC038_2021 [Leptospira weilii str. 2006001855]|uniref:Uncharacterized protein n=1 Tax=Leptospira weilii str. 2006001855 TaxID=996804 RepID=M6FNH7_9LEPT|nr:hypothetical protein LEP1GSC038_2021 [Leptospira weilii str. 2006001855]